MALPVLLRPHQVGSNALFIGVGQVSIWVVLRDHLRYTDRRGLKTSSWAVPGRWRQPGNWWRLAWFMWSGHELSGRTMSISDLKPCRRYVVPSTKKQDPTGPLNTPHANSCSGYHGRPLYFFPGVGKLRRLGDGKSWRHVLKIMHKYCI